MKFARTTLVATVMAAMMVSVSLASSALKPTAHLADDRKRVDLSALLPERFGDWHEDVQPLAQLVNPQQKETLDKIYSQVLTRSYINAAGYRIMLSVAYGIDQSDNMQVHKPEICYPAQGFQLWNTQRGSLHTEFGDIPVRRLVTSLGPRHEPVTYWTTVGDNAVNSGLEKKLAEMRYRLTGKIPDGLLFRVSSIDGNDARAFSTQDSFVNQLMSATAREARTRLGGLDSTSN